MTDRIWISWNEQRRNVGMAASVNARLYMTDRDAPGGRTLITEFIDSWKIIRRERPSVCFTMNPSIFSSWWLSLLARVYKFNLVTDLHTPTIELNGINKKVFRFFFNSGIRRSDYIIVTNRIYRDTVLPLNPNVLIIPDPLPVLTGVNVDARRSNPDTVQKTRILFICSFDADEPVQEVIALDQEIDGFEIIVSGNWKKMFDTLPATKNIRFLGFVPKEEYDKTLLSVDGIITLTGREGCLCCGAYEAFAAGKPLILSRTGALQAYFGKAPIYTDHSSDSILSSLRQLKAERAERAALVEQERRVLTGKFEESIEKLENILSGLVRT